MQSKLISGMFCVSMLALSACGGGGSREKISLAYPGQDARSTTDALSAAISDAGMSPNCKDKRFCKFKFNDQGTVHFKLTKKDPTLVLEISDSVEEGERGKLEADMTKLAKEIWSKASQVALEREESQAQAKASEREAERAADIEKERIAAAERVESQKIQAENQKQAEAKAVADEEAKKVYETITFEGKSNGGSAVKVENPEGAMCTSTSDNSGRSKSLEVPFQIEATPGAYYTLECTLPSGSFWRKKVQTKDRFVTVVQLRQGAK